MSLLSQTNFVLDQVTEAIMLQSRILLLPIILILDLLTIVIKVNALRLNVVPGRFRLSNLVFFERSLLFGFIRWLL